MSVATDALWRRVQRKALSMTPDMSRAYLKAYDILRQLLTKSEVEAMLAQGNADTIVANILNDATMRAALSPIRVQLQQAVQQGVDYFAKSVPSGPSVKPPSLVLGDAERTAMQQKGLYLHGTRADFAAFQQGGHGAIYLSEPGVRKTQAEYIAEKEGRLLTVRVNESMLKTFDPLNDAEAMRVWRSVMGDVRYTGAVPWPKMTEITAAAQRAGYNDFVVDEPSVQGRSRAITDPGALTIESVRGGAPAASLPPPPTVTVAFDMLNPRVLDAVKQLDDNVMRPLSATMRETVRKVIADGLVEGLNPRALIAELRDSIGLAPNQLQSVLNYEQALRGGEQTMVYADALQRVLRDRRFDSVLQTARDTGIPLTEEQITAMVDAYRRRFIAFNTETQARTATLNSLKLGQRLTYDDAIEKGILDGTRLMKRWTGVMDDRERDEHIEMEGETVPWDSPYSNGQMEPGDDEYNCRCLSTPSLEPATAD